MVAHLLIQRYLFFVCEYMKDHMFELDKKCNDKNEFLQAIFSQSYFCPTAMPCGWGVLVMYSGVALASWLVRSTPERAVRVRALVRDIALCSWPRHFTRLTVPLSTQVYKWVPANVMLGVTLWSTSIPLGWLEILLVASSCRNWDYLQPDEPLGSYADFTFQLRLYDVQMFVPVIGQRRRRVNINQDRFSAWPSCSTIWKWKGNHWSLLAMRTRRLHS